MATVFDRKPGPRRFSTKQDAFRMAVAIKWCLQCQKPAGVDKGSKGMYCACGNKAQHFHSTGEFKHYTHLHMLQTCGEISRLQLQPRFPMFFNFINGTPVISPVGEWKWGTYVGDFLYFDKAGVQQVVDFKGHKDHQDRTSQKLREAAEHCYQFKVNIVTR